MSRLLAADRQPGAIQQMFINSFCTVEIFFCGGHPAGVKYIMGAARYTNYQRQIWRKPMPCNFYCYRYVSRYSFLSTCYGQSVLAQKKYKSVSAITIVCAVVNIGLNLILIPRFQGFGAAASFFATTLLQGALYYRLVCKQIMLLSLRPVLFFFRRGNCNLCFYSPAKCPFSCYSYLLR